MGRNTNSFFPSSGLRQDLWGTALFSTSLFSLLPALVSREVAARRALLPVGLMRMPGTFHGRAGRIGPIRGEADVNQTLALPQNYGTVISAAMTAS